MTVWILVVMFGAWSDVDAFASEEKCRGMAAWATNRLGAIAYCEKVTVK